jgi:hypothetical protein
MGRKADIFHEHFKHMSLYASIPEVANFNLHAVCDKKVAKTEVPVNDHSLLLQIMNPA